MSLAADLDVTVDPESVEFHVLVTNTAPDPVELEFPTGQLTDLVVREGDAEVWRWSGDRLFTQAIHHETLAPGEAITSELAWEDPTPGEYTAEATLEAADTDVGATATFAVG